MSEIPQAPYAVPNPPSGNGIPSTQTSTLAIVSLVLGIASFVCTLLVGVPAIILGIIALSKTSKSGGRLRGRNLAIGGIVTGAMGCLLSVAMLIPAVMAVRTAAKQTHTINNVRQIVLGFHHHESANRQFPSNITDGIPEGGLSWRVRILPWLGSEENQLFDQFHFDEPWDSPHNKTLIPLMPAVYQHPQLQPNLPVGHTVFQMPTSSPDDEVRAVHVEGQPGITVGKISDGTSNTIVLIETDAQSAVPWTKPVDWHFDPNYPKRNLGNTFPNGTTVGMGDGSVFVLDAESVSDAEARALFTPKGGEIIAFPH